jgi:hypothetical protein
MAPKVDTVSGWLRRRSIEGAEAKAAVVEVFDRAELAARTT